MATRKAGKSPAKERSREEGIFVRKMFAYALVAMESLPSHRQDQPFLRLAQIVLEHYPEPQRLLRHLDEARARIQQRGEAVRGEAVRGEAARGEAVRGEVVRLDDYRYRYSKTARD